MNWSLITEDWRVKILALALAGVMLGAVAFAQNPPTTGSQTIGLNYTPGPGIVLLNPPPKITVTYTGLADVISRVSPSNLVATVDATHAKPGKEVKLDVTVKALIGPLTIVQPAPIAVDIDASKGVDLQVSISAQAAPGWSINTAKTFATCPGAVVPNPCTVHFTGPASWQNGLSAYVPYPTPVNSNSIDAPNYQIKLKNSTGQVDLTDIPTIPLAGLDVTTASLHIEAQPGSTSSTVALLDAPPTHGPAAGYRITAIVITPATVTITGDPIALGRTHSITLAPVDLTGRTSDATFQVQIAYPQGTSGTIQVATIKYSISANPNVTSPSP